MLLFFARAEKNDDTERMSPLVSDIEGQPGFLSKSFLPSREKPVLGSLSRGITGVRDAVTGIFKGMPVLEDAANALARLI